MPKAGHKQLLLSLSPEMMAGLDRQAGLRRMSKTAAIREAVELWLDACNRVPEKMSISYVYDRAIDRTLQEVEEMNKRWGLPTVAAGAAKPDWAEQHEQELERIRRETDIQIKREHRKK
jgi:hypothetical protein